MNWYDGEVIKTLTITHANNDAAMREKKINRIKYNGPKKSDETPTFKEIFDAKMEQHKDRNDEQ